MLEFFDRAAVDFPISPLAMVALFGAIGGLAAALANRGVSIFHDGLRPLIPELRSGELERKEVSTTAFNLGLGFVLFFALPFSIGLNVPVIHLIFMATDWIGVTLVANYTRPWHATRESRLGLAGAIAGGAAWGILLALALAAVYAFLRETPVEMLGMTADFVEPALRAFFLFPVLTVAYYFGLRQGIAALALATVAWFASDELGAAHPVSWAFLAGVAALVAFLVLRRRRAASVAVAPTELDEELRLLEAEAAAEDRRFFEENVARLKRTLLPTAVLYGLMGAAFNYPVFANEPLQGALYSRGLVFPAVLVALAWGFAFGPMKYTTAVTTGAMMTGTFYEAALAMLMPNPAVAFAALFVLRIVEVYALLPTLTLLERVPEIREIADTMRTAIAAVMEIAFLVGGALAAASIAGGYGFAFVIAVWWLNNRASSPIMPMAVGPAAAIAVGLIVNLFHVLGLGA